MRVAMLCKRQHRGIEMFPLAEICFSESDRSFDKKISMSIRISARAWNVSLHSR